MLTSNNIIAPPSLDNRNKQQNAFGSRLELEVVAGRDAGRKEASGGRAGQGGGCDATMANVDLEFELGAGVVGGNSSCDGHLN